MGTILIGVETMTEVAEPNINGELSDTMGLKLGELRSFQQRPWKVILHLISRALNGEVVAF